MEDTTWSSLTIIKVPGLLVIYLPVSARVAALVLNSHAKFSYTTNVTQVPGSTLTRFVPRPRKNPRGPSCAHVRLIVAGIVGKSSA